MSDVNQTPTGKRGRTGLYERTYDPTKAERDELIAAYYARGNSLRKTGKVFGLTAPRVRQILAGQSRNPVEAGQVRKERRQPDDKGK